MEGRLGQWEEGEKVGKEEVVALGVFFERRGKNGFSKIYLITLDIEMHLIKKKSILNTARYTYKTHI